MPKNIAVYEKPEELLDAMLKKEFMTNKDRTGNERQNRLREARTKWLVENAYGLSPEGLIGALMRGEGVLSWKSVPTQRRADSSKRGRSARRRVRKSKVSAPA